MPRDSAAAAIAALGELGLGSAMITGDNQRTAEAVAARLGITRVEAEVMPEEKRRQSTGYQAPKGCRLRRRRDQRRTRPGRRRCRRCDRHGDRRGHRNSRCGADGRRPRPGGHRHPIGARTLAVIRQNLFWAFGYNVAAIPLAAVGLLDPMIAAVAMALSSVSVVTNSLRLRRFDR